MQDKQTGTQNYSNTNQTNQNNSVNQNNDQTETNQVPNYNNYAANASNSAKKSKAPIIIVVVLIVVLLLGCIILGIIFGAIGFLNKLKNESVNNTYGNYNSYSNYSNYSNYNNTQNSLNELKNKTNNILNNITNTNANSQTNTNTSTNTNTNTTNTSTVTDAKTSTRENPLTKGTWGIASKYSTEAGEDEEVYVKVTNIVRGDEAKKAVQDYVNKSSFYTYQEPKEGLEWVVVDYDLDYANFTKSSIGEDARVTVSLKGSGTRTSVVYNGMTYILTSTYIGPSDYVKTQTATGKVAFQMPIGCTEYVMKFGSDDDNSAYFKGE